MTTSRQGDATEGTLEDIKADLDALVVPGIVPGLPADAWPATFSTALEASHIVLGAPGVIRSLAVRLDSTAASGTYYVQVLDSATLPANGAVTHLIAPTKKQHTSGTDDNVSLDFSQNGVAAVAGAVVVLSTTEFTKTIAGAFLSVTALYKTAT